MENKVKENIKTYSKENDIQTEKCTQKEDVKIAFKVSYVSIIVNAVLTIGKFMAGIFAHSGAMISDAVHSASDIFSTIIVMIGVKISGKEPDEQHQYGHERLECVAAIVLAVILFETGVTIGLGGIKTILGGNYHELTVPGMMALIAAIVSIVVKEWMYWYTRAAAKKINSGALMADAWHHRSDALSSVGALLGIGGAMLGFPVMDSVASVLISVFILKAAIDIFCDAINKMVDRACDKETVLRVREIVLKNDEIKSIDSLQTRMFGNKIYVDMEISLDGNMTLTESHEIAEDIHLSIEKEFPTVKHCMVHVNPVTEEEKNS